MKINADGMVELTEGEQVLKEIVSVIAEDNSARVLDTLTEIRDQVPLDGKVFALLSNADFCLYLAGIQNDEQATSCSAGYVTGGSDPSGTDCDLPANHYPATKHEGACPFGSKQRVRWDGGGFCVGDPLPYRNVEYIDS